MDFREACIEGDLAGVRLELARGADPCALMEDGFAATHLAAMNGRPEVLKLLLETGATTETRARCRDWTPLLAAAHHGRLEVVKCLLSRGADPQARGAQSRTAVDEALAHRHYHVAEHMVDLGVCASLHNLCALGRLEDLIEVPYHEFLRWDSTYAQTPLLEAQSHGRRRVVEWVLGLDVELDQWHGAALGLAVAGDLEVVDEHRGWTPLLWAAAYGQPTVVQRLRTQGADLEATAPDGSSFLHLAAQEGRTSVVGLAIEWGLDLRMLDGRGWTALHHAVFQAREKTALLLLEHGADPNFAGPDGLRPLDLFHNPETQGAIFERMSQAASE